MDLVKQLEKWISMGDCLVVCMTTDENIYTKRIGKDLTRSDGLNMADMVGDCTG